MAQSVNDLAFPHAAGAPAGDARQKSAPHEAPFDAVFQGALSDEAQGPPAAPAVRETDYLKTSLANERGAAARIARGSSPRRDVATDQNDRDARVAASNHASDEIDELDARDDRNVPKEKSAATETDQREEPDSPEASTQTQAESDQPQENDADSDTALASFGDAAEATDAPLVGETADGSTKNGAADGFPPDEAGPTAASDAQDDVGAPEKALMRGGLEVSRPHGNASSPADVAPQDAPGGDAVGEPALQVSADEATIQSAAGESQSPAGEASDAESESGPSLESAALASEAQQGSDKHHDGETSHRGRQEEASLTTNSSNVQSELGSKSVVESAEAADDAAASPVENATTSELASSRATAEQGPSSLERLASARPVHPTARSEETSSLSTVDRARFVSRVSGAIEQAQNRDGRVKVRLSPPELGSLRIEITVRQGVMSAQVETDTASARNILLENLPALRDRLADQNIRVEQFDVDVRRDGQQPTHDPGPSDRRQEQESQRQTRQPGRDDKLSELTTGPLEEHASGNTDAALDVLI